MEANAVIKGYEMKRRRIGKTDIEVSVMGLGSWAIGGGPRWGDNDDNESIFTIRAAVERGINLIDTAPDYGAGHGECVVGKAIQGIRDQVVLTTKCGLVWDDRPGSYFFTRGGVEVRKNLSAASIKQDVEDSLSRLHTDYIDIYLTHWQSVPPYFTPVEETMGALLELKQQGKIRAIGACNVEESHIREYLKYGRIDVVQNKYSLLDVQAEDDVLPVCKKNQITLEAYSSLELGLLTGSIPADYVPAPENARNGKYWFEPHRLRMAVEMMEGWADLREKYEATQAQLSIAALAEKHDNVILLCGARKMFQLEDNIKGGSLEIEKEDLNRIYADVETLIRKAQ